MKQWQKLAITAGVIFIVLAFVLIIEGSLGDILQSAIDWTFINVFNFDSAPQLF